MCDDVDDCVGAFDECGVCNGDGIADGACDCDGNVADCAGDCGGSAVEDACGECGGDGSSCEETTVDILYSSDADIYGFQFNVDGASVSGASGGDAAANGFTVSTSSTTVLGFSFTGSYIPAGSGVLTTLTVTGGDPCLSGLVLSGEGGSTLESEVVECLTASYSAP